MEASPLHRLPAELASDLERKYFWWDAVDAQPRSDDRILAQAMDLASFADVRRLETRLGLQRLADAMLAAEPGWISDRSWEFWRGRLRSIGPTIPQTPPRRRFDAGLL
jgi:hypothetical protein